MALDEHDRGKAFWQWFEGSFPRLRDVKTGQEPILGELNAELLKVHQGLVWEFGRGVDHEFEFTVSADGMIPVIPEVQALVAAPQPFQGAKLRLSGNGSPDLRCRCMASE
jgi:hypothetical protein